MTRSTWRFEHTARSGAASAAIWRRYVDVVHWRDWSRAGVVWSRLEGPFEVGTKGRCKPPGLPAGRFRLSVVEPEHRFATETHLPGARLVFEHVIEPLEDGVNVTHRAHISGPLTFLYRWILRRSIERALPDGVENLAKTTARLS